MDTKTILGWNLKRFRKKKALSQEQLAETLDVSVKHLSAVERGLTFVSADLLNKLSKVLEVPIYSFFEQESDRLEQGMANAYKRESILNHVESIIEQHLLKTIDEIKAEIREGEI
jgi:transcriptional regulator with XRE-family HTH domain